MLTSMRSLAALAASVLATLSVHGAEAQVTTPEPITARTAVYLEAGGNAGLGSANYDRLLLDNLSVRGGVFILPVAFDWNGASGAAVFPLTVQALMGRSSHRMEIGGGATVFTGSIDSDLLGIDEDGTAVVPTGVFGYRYQRPAGGFMFRVTFTPLLFDSETVAWMGISFGRSF